MKTTIILNAIISVIISKPVSSEDVLTISKSSELSQTDESNKIDIETQIKTKIMKIVIEKYRNK